MSGLKELLGITDKTPREEKRRKIYRYLVSRMIEEKTGLKKIDEKLKNLENLPYLSPGKKWRIFRDRII